jgi:hypothetical protein
VDTDAGGNDHLKFKRTRIVLQDGEFVQPMLAIGISSDGGLILDLSNAAPTHHYRYGVVDVPAGEGSWAAPVREDEASWSVSVAPKLHYHRSGLISLNATERLERQGIHATPIGEIGRDQHKHVFSFVARHPSNWQKVSRRKTDLAFVPSQPPTTITIAGHIGPIENLKHETHPENPWAIMVQDEDGTVVPTIVARLEMDDPRYYLWIELHPDRPFSEGPDPGLILYAFDPYAAEDHASPTSMVGIWSVPAAVGATAPPFG